MIAAARERAEAISANLLGSVEFATANALQLDEPSEHYDVVIATRVITNLGPWSNQLAGLRECARVLKVSGRLLLSEPTIQGWSRLNRFRREWGLADIPMPAFNEYFDTERVTAELTDRLELLELLDFASTYYVGTRVLKPLRARRGLEVDVADPTMEWNRWFGSLPAAGDYGTQKLFIFRKL